MEPSHRFGPVSIFLGDKSGKYPDGNQVLVDGSDVRVAFDTPLVANRIGAAFDEVDLVILGHVHEDHMAGLHRVPRARVQVHEADLAAAQSWQGLSRHYGYPRDVLSRSTPSWNAISTTSPGRTRPAMPTALHGIWAAACGARAPPARAYGRPLRAGGGERGPGLHRRHRPDRFRPYYGDATSDLGAFRRSLAAVAQLDAGVWVTSHHRAVLTDRAEFRQQLERFASRIDERTETLLGYLREGPQTLSQLTRRRILYPLGFSVPFVDFAERNSIRMHLDELVAQGRVRSEGGVFGLA